MKQNKVLIVLLMFGLTGCAGYWNRVYDLNHPNEVAHRNRNAEIEQAYKAGEITKKEYLEMKLENDKLLKSDSVDMNVRHY
jgi:hypothetical protein